MRLQLLITALCLMFLLSVQSAIGHGYGSTLHKSNCINRHGEGEKEFHWSYEGNTGPEHWADQFHFCGGQRQSPIDLYEGIPIAAPQWEPFEFNHYDDIPVSAKVKNNGHSVVITMDMVNRPYVRGGNFKSEYEFVQAHFHWGIDNNNGSEHYIEHSSYPMEVHLVHFRKIYGDLSTAIEYEDGLGVLGAMFTITQEDNTDLVELLKGLANVIEPDQESFIRSIPLSTFLPKDRTKFYRYMGSLTTPPCNEVVVWTVFQDKLNISAAQLARFRDLKDLLGHHMHGNYRPIQSIGARQVYLANLL